MLPWSINVCSDNVCFAAFACNCESVSDRTRARTRIPRHVDLHEGEWLMPSLDCRCGCVGRGRRVYPPTHPPLARASCHCAICEGHDHHHHPSEVPRAHTARSTKEGVQWLMCENRARLGEPSQACANLAPVEMRVVGHDPAAIQLYQCTTVLYDSVSHRRLLYVNLIRQYKCHVFGDYYYPLCLGYNLSPWSHKIDSTSTRTQWCQRSEHRPHTSAVGSKGRWL